MTTIWLYGGIALGVLAASLVYAAVETGLEARKERGKAAAAPESPFVLLDAGAPERLEPCAHNTDLSFEKLFAKYFIPTWIWCGGGNEED